MKPLFFLLLAFPLPLMLSCGPVDTGNPPLMPSDTIADVDLVDGQFLLGGGTTLTGGAGAITPATGFVHVTNLDSSGEVQIAPVEADGSFAVSLLADFDDVLRLQVVDGPDRSVPIDSADGFETTLPDALACLEMPKWIGVALAPGDPDSVSFEVTNLCDETVEWGTWRSRASAGLITSIPAAASLALGESRSFVVRVSPEAGEEVLLLPIVAPAESRRALTVSVAVR